MKKVFVKTKNVKRFTSLMEELKNLPPNIPKIALVYGEFGLGKSETIQWWSFKNNSVYVRAKQKMSPRWLLADIAEEIGEEPFWHTSETFNLIKNYLIQNPKTIIIDEADYLIEKNTIEILRDLHDRTGCPLVLVGMGNIDKKLRKYPHLIDRIYKSFRFEKYDIEDIKTIFEELSEISITEDGLEYLSTRADQFRQIVKLINKIEKLAKTNEIEELNEYIIRELLNERQNITTLQKVG
ncbi:MAG: hypothetical protein BHW55_00945 [Candidatus Melainabacteria bacterium 35_41]|nr:MAG: hypothetical protein BHW55_00945 [Candidatus Melainabacteria bacterium 35_41]